MLLSEFIETVCVKIKGCLSERFSDADISIRKVEKLGSSYSGLIVRLPDSTCAPSIDLDMMYEDYSSDEDLDRVLDRIASIIEQAECGRYRDVEDVISDYSEARKSLFVRLSNTARNMEILRSVPHRMEEDLVVTYHINLGMESGRLSSTIVTDDLMKRYGVDEDQLYEDAVANSADMFKAKVMNITDAVGLPELDVPMYVLTNQIFLNGAAAILYPDVLHSISQKLGEDLYVLPSSIHELICVPASVGKVSELVEMVKDVNSSLVSEEEQLSDNVYFYNSHTDSWGLAEVNSAGPLSPQC